MALRPKGGVVCQNMGVVCTKGRGLWPHWVVRCGLPDSIRDTEGAEGTLKGLSIRTPHA